MQTSLSRSRPLTPADTRAFRAALDALAERITPSVVIYNAAVLAEDGILTSDTGYLLNAFTIDVLGAVTAAQVFTTAMTEAGTGTLLITGGGLALDPHPQQVTAGQALIDFDLETISRAGLSPITPVLITNAATFASITPTTHDHVSRGGALLTLTPQDQDQ